MSGVGPPGCRVTALVGSVVCARSMCRRSLHVVFLYVCEKVGRGGVVAGLLLFGIVDCRCMAASVLTKSLVFVLSMYVV